MYEKTQMGTKDSNPPKDIAAKPSSSMVALLEDPSEYNYFVPVFPRAYHRLEARAKPIPTIKDQASDIGFGPTPVIKIIIMVKMIFQSCGYDDCRRVLTS
jgi:hypothetical protein